ncbi:MAG TPA: hypothetical protein VLM40_04265, partial [Gemmata sp.]|nr:hypothetical protein [Gemmata sp.]
MKRRRVAILVMFVFVAAGFTCWLDPAARVEGWLRGEPFYRGRSATAWRRDLRHQDESRSAEAYRLLVEGKVEAVPVCAWLLRTAPEA